MKQNNIHLALGFDNNYIVHIYAMITSVFHNNRKNKLVLHVIATGISNKDKDEFTDYVKKNNAEVIFYDITEHLNTAKIFIPADSYFTVATFYRLFFADLLDPGIKKLLYIDPDTIVLGDLQELYNLDIGSLAIAAVPDPHFESREELGIKNRGEYFNAGVMLIDLDNWRSQKVSEKVLSFVGTYPERVPYLDQDGLNATLAGKWYPLNIKYNFMLAYVKLQVPAKELLKDVLIVHYTSWRKPWLSLSRNKLRSMYHHYLKLSPKANVPRYVDFSWDIKSLFTFSRIRIKEFYFDKKIHSVLPLKKWINSSDLEY